MIESIRSKLRRLMVKGFYQIQSGKGYSRDIKLVKELWTDYENIPEYPMINIFPIGELYSSAGSQNGNYTMGMLEKVVVFSIDYIDRVDEDPLLAQEQMISDMETYIGNYYMIPDTDNPADYGCRESIIISNQAFGITSNPNFLGVTFKIHCYIGQNILNPGVR